MAVIMVMSAGLSLKGLILKQIEAFSPLSGNVNELEKMTFTALLLPGILKKYPTCISVLYNMAYILKMEDNIDPAISFYKKTLELDPDREESHFGLGMAYLVKGDFKNGWDIHERYLKRTGRNAETLLINKI